MKIETLSKITDHINNIDRLSKELSIETEELNLLLKSVKPDLANEFQFNKSARKSQILELHKVGFKVDQIAQIMGVSIRTIFRDLKLVREDKTVMDPVNTESNPNYVKSKCELFLTHFSKFEWFIIKYFGAKKSKELIDMAKNNNPKILKELSDIWFYLPDNKFNIIENPEGWSEFLRVIED